MSKEQRREYYNRPEVHKKRLAYMKKYVLDDDVRKKRKEYGKIYWEKNKDKIKVNRLDYDKKWRENNREKLKVYRKEWRLKNIIEVRKKDNERVKNPKDRERRRINSINFRKRNPKYMSAYSMRYYFANQEEVDKTHAKWTKKATEKWGSLSKRYNLNKNKPVSDALARARGTKGNIEHQTIKAIKNDIRILKREITKLKEKNKQWIFQK